MATKSKYIYIRVSRDKYEHIVAMGDTAVELAKLCKTTPDTIYSSIHHKKGTFSKVLIEEGS